uniref:Uncharacterized protein n=1 Tax=Anguilla anguilla TaxID=7936 RepID=A0A0E9U9Q2_ANGAN
MSSSFSQSTFCSSYGLWEIFYCKKTD